MNSLIRSTLRRSLTDRSAQSVQFGQIRRLFKIDIVAMMEEAKATNYVRVR